MKIVQVDSRPLAIAVAKPQSDLFWNWKKEVWEFPFLSANHLLTLGLMEKSPSLFSRVLYADIGDVMKENLDACLLVCIVDGTGTLASIVDSWGPAIALGICEVVP